MAVARQTELDLAIIMPSKFVRIFGTPNNNHSLVTQNLDISYQVPVA